MGQMTVPISIAAFVLLAMPASGLAEEPTPSVAVQGQAEVSVAPDEAFVVLGVDVEAPDAAAAQRQANGVANAILTALRAENVPDSDIQTSTLTLTPVYRAAGGSRGERERVAYRARNTVRVRVSELERLGPVIDAGLRAGANGLEGVRFDLEDDTLARKEALSRAVEQASGKAATIAAALHMRLGEILEAREGSVGVTPVFAQASMLRSEGAMSTPVAPGQVTVSANVTLRYALVK